MEFGVTIFPTSTTITVKELAQVSEDLGFNSLFFPEHTHIPVSRVSIYEPEGNADLAPEFSHGFDPFVALTTAAAVTTTLRVGTGLCLAAQRDPIILAKEISTLDVLSGGRTVIGVGPGWNREEMRNHGIDPALRHRILEEHVEAMKAIWTSDEAEFHGEFVNFDPIWQWPKPIQQPHPPLLIGGSGPFVLGRVVKYGDGWLASAKREVDTTIKSRIDELQALAAAAGRDRMPVSLQRCRAEESALEHYYLAGVDLCIFGLNNGTRDEVMAELEELGALIEMYRGRDGR